MTDTTFVWYKIDISPEAESEMQKLLDKYADYFLPRASSSSTSNDTLNAHGNTQTALGTGPNSTVGQLVQPALLGQYEFWQQLAEIYPYIHVLRKDFLW